MSKALNYLCENDDSDEDRNMCMKRGIIFKCPSGCPDFIDVRANMPEGLLKERERIMKAAGITDTFPLGEKP